MARLPYATEREHGQFTNGEKYLHAQPDVDAGNKGQWYLSRWMRFDGGMYTIKALVDDTATWWLGRRGNEVKTILFHMLSDGVVTREVFIPAGIQRLDIVVDNVPEGVSPTFIVFSIWQGDHLVYASDAPGWLVDYRAIPDESLTPLSDPRRDLPVLTLLPNWKDGVTERLAWYTDVMQSESAAEQRRALRMSPRRTFEVSFLRKGVTRAMLDNFFVAVGRNEIMIPMWHEAVRMTEGITANAGGVSFEGSAPLSMREFRQGDLVFVNNGNPKVYDILEVGDTQLTRFDWKVTPHRSWPKGTRIYPMRRARIIDPPQMSNITDQVARVQVRFDLVEPDERIPAWGSEFDGTGLFLFQPNRVEPIQISYDRHTYTLDNESSVPEITDPGGQAQVDLTASFMFRGRQQISELRSFLAAARGQAVGFYMLTYTDDVRLSADISGEDAWIDVEDSSYAEYMEIAQPVRLMLGVWAYGRGVIVRTITGADPGRLYLNEPLPPLERYEIRRICFLTPARFAQDAVELQHITAESTVITSRLIFRQLYNKRQMLPA